MAGLDSVLQGRLAERAVRGLSRQRKLVVGAHSPTLSLDGEPCVSFCSNDYLGLAADPRIGQAFQDGVKDCGAGSGASQLVTGHNAEHAALENDLAAFTGRQRALLFSTGYMANVGTITALVGRGDRVLSDELNHASLIDGIRLSGADREIVPHGDVDGFETRLGDPANGNTLLVTDALFSMDGDRAPLGQLAASAAAHDAWLMVDDAHGFGVLGPDGAGAVSEAGLGASDVPVLVATLGKSVGVFGAFVAGSETLIESLIQTSRSYIYTTAPPPAMARAARVGLRLLQQESWRREALFDRIEQYRSGVTRLGLSAGAARSPIQPLIVGDADRAVHLSDNLRGMGIHVAAIRPPTVPAGSSRLRITLSAAHSAEQVDSLLQALDRCREQFGQVA